MYGSMGPREDGDWVRRDDAEDAIAKLTKERDVARAELESSRKIVTALLAGNDALRDRTEAAERLLHEASEEIERLKQPEALWYEHAMELMAVAPNHVAASFDMGGRRVEIVFYQAGGKTPGEVAAELREKVEAMRPVVEVALRGRDGASDDFLEEWLGRLDAAVDAYEASLAKGGDCTCHGARDHGLAQCQVHSQLHAYWDGGEVAP